jgi:agmatine deiminase
MRIASLNLNVACEMNSGEPSRQGILPSSMTPEERAGDHHADGVDWRDSNPDYAFTAPPGDVAGLPGEFEQSDELLLTWDSGTDSAGPGFFSAIVGASVGRGRLNVLSASTWDDQWTRTNAINLGVDAGSVSIVRAQHDSFWMRDYGPLVVRTSTWGKRVIDLRYYSTRGQDDRVPTLLARSHWAWPVSRPPLELEGGNFLSDGAGKCVMTEHALDENAHFGYASTDLSLIAEQFFGCQSLTLVPALVGEPTGHVDMFATITSPGEIIVGRYGTDQDATNAVQLDEGARRLGAAGFVVRRIPMPRNADGVFRSYTNSLALNDVVLVPVYSDDRASEDSAMEVFTSAYPNRGIVPIDATQMIRHGGAVHCTTMSVAH